MGKPIRPGTPAPESGQYRRVGPGAPRGNNAVEVTAIRNKPLPPTPEPGQGYRLVDPTKHER